VPTFNDPADRVALRTLAKLFPGRVVTGISCVELIWGFGALHCMTQQQPVGSGEKVNFAESIRRHVKPFGGVELALPRRNR
jgi:hypothetical protein